MEISHMNRIGKHLDILGEWPCCRSTGEEEFIITPTRLSFKQLVDDLPCLMRCDLGERECPSRDHSFESLIEQRLFQFLNSKSYSPRQNRAIDAFRVIHGEVLRNFKGHGINIRDTRQYAACFDDLLFDGKLLERCAIYYSDGLPGGDAGLTDVTHYCDEHQQCHAARIYLRRGLFQHDVSPESRVEDLLGLLLHELCHAWVAMFFDFRGITVKDALHDLGATFHGRAWSWVMRIGIIAASHLFQLNIDEDRHCHNSFEKDYHMEHEIDSLRTQITWSFAEDPRYVQRMVEEHLSITQDHASHFLPLLAKGFTVLQATSLVKELEMDLWLSPEMRTLVPKEWNYVAHEPLSDWNKLRAGFRKDLEHEDGWFRSAMDKEGL
ncbi:MAG: hypothetical protein Q9191_001022 [Dirinaria sp. TL-2023a]